MNEVTLKATYLSLYKKNGRTIFVYKVRGSEEAIERYEAIKGANNRKHEDGSPLYYTTRYFSDNLNLRITINDNIVEDNPQLDKAKAMVESVGGDFGTAMANQMANAMLSQVLGGRAMQASPAPANSQETAEAIQEPENAENVEAKDIGED